MVLETAAIVVVGGGRGGVCLSSASVFVLTETGLVVLKGAGEWWKIE